MSAVVRPSLPLACQCHQVFQHNHAAMGFLITRAALAAFVEARPAEKVGRKAPSSVIERIGVPCDPKRAAAVFICWAPGVCRIALVVDVGP